MQNPPRNELEQIAKIRHIKIYKNISKKGLLIALLKSERSFAELQKINSNNARIEKFIKNFNVLRHKFQKTKLITKTS